MTLCHCTTCGHSYTDHLQVHKHGFESPCAVEQCACEVFAPEVSATLFDGDVTEGETD